MTKVILKIILKCIKFYAEVMIVYSFLEILSSGMKKDEISTKKSIENDMGYDFT